MIGTLPYLPLPTGQEQDAGPWESLSEVDKEQAADIAESLFNLLSPLAQMTSRAALDDLLESRAPRFVRLKTRLLELLLPTIESLKEQRDGLHEAARKIVLSKTDLLGEEASQALLGAIESDASLTEWVIKVDEQGPYYVGTLVQQISGAGIYSVMCINTLMGILTDQINNWIPEAISVLAEAADDYMAEVEDVFLAQSEMAGDSEETVDYESLRKELGL